MNSFYRSNWFGKCAIVPVLVLSAGLVARYEAGAQPSEEGMRPIQRRVRIIYSQEGSSPPSVTVQERDDEASGPMAVAGRDDPVSAAPSEDAALPSIEPGEVLSQKPSIDRARRGDAAEDLTAKSASAVVGSAGAALGKLEPAELEPSMDAREAPPQRPARAQARREISAEDTPVTASAPAVTPSVQPTGRAGSAASSETPAGGLARADAGRQAEESPASAPAVTPSVQPTGRAVSSASSETPAGSPARADAGRQTEESPASAASPRRTRTRRDEGFMIERVVIEADTIDQIILAQLGMESKVLESLSGQQTFETIAQRIGEIREALIEQGYYAVIVNDVTSDYDAGELMLYVNVGRFGEMKLRSSDGSPYRGRWFSERQIQKRLQPLRRGPFSFETFYNTVVNANLHPDIKLDSDLLVRDERDDQGRLRRYVDMVVSVEERIPLHAVLEVRNSGTSETEEWRGAVTLQHLNLTKHDDVLTLTVPFSLDFDTSYAGAGSYYFPHEIWKGGAFTIWGGYSRLESDSIFSGELEDLVLKGDGWFAGVQGTMNIVSTPRRLISAGLGYTRQEIKDSLFFKGTDPEPRKALAAPFSLVFSYSDLRPDALHGRSFLTAQTTVHRGGLLGASEDDDFTLQRVGAEADFWLQRMQLARIQPLSGLPQAGGSGQASLFLKLDGQYAPQALIPAEQKQVGGMGSVRGYKEREILGDYGLSGTIELRSPIWSFTGRNEAGHGLDRWQVLVFFDAAQVHLQDTFEGEVDNFNLMSVGAGLRLGISRYAQFGIDYGYALEDIVFPGGSGRSTQSGDSRLHVLGQVMF